MEIASSTDTLDHEVAHGRTRSLIRTIRDRAAADQRSAAAHAQERRVAAVCYRVRGTDIQFLLVQSRSGRWTFPKGRVENDPCQAAAAAREAIEEAGAYGRVDQKPFASYLHAKAPKRSPLRHGQLVEAHLCEVVEMVDPEERFRNPTWFSSRRSKLQLQGMRSPSYGQELSRVVDRALERIGRRHGICVVSR